MSVGAGDDVAQILNVDPEQLAQLLSESADGTAQLIDEHGNTITLTAEQFANAGFDVVGSAAAVGENQQYVQGEDGQIYMIENQEQLVTPKIQKMTQQQQQEKVAPKTAADQQLIDDYRRLLQEKEQRLLEMEQKLKETTEQNVIMAHALVSTCKSQEADLDDGKRQIGKKDGSASGDVLKTPSLASRAALESTIYRRSNDAFQIGFLPYPCDQCPRRFAQELHLKRHLEMAHAKRRPFYCQYCNRDLYLASDLHFQGHMRMQHKQEMEHEANLRHGIIEQNEPPQTQAAAAFVPRETYEPEQEPDWEDQEEEQKVTKYAWFTICWLLYTIHVTGPRGLGG
uniref:C2H2-type domain-containing protein n=2 Tax=Romanomermis culicivorax TaxID=13658 RepID=A0A915HWB0_ROMCU